MKQLSPKRLTRAKTLQPEVRPICPARSEARAFSKSESTKGRHGLAREGMASRAYGRGRTNLHRLTFQKENTTTWLSSDVLHRLLWYIYASDTAGMSACNHRMHAKNMSIWVSLDMWHKRADSSPQAIRCVKINKIKILAMTHEVL